MGCDDGRERDRPVSGTMGDGNQGPAAADDLGADAQRRERWYAMLLPAQGLTAAALERDPHTIGRWAAAFGEGGPRALIFEQTGGSPPPLTRRGRRS